MGGCGGLGWHGQRQLGRATPGDWGRGVCLSRLGSLWPSPCLINSPPGPLAPPPAHAKKCGTSLTRGPPQLPPCPSPWSSVWVWPRLYLPVITRPRCPPGALNSRLDPPGAPRAPGLPSSPLPLCPAITHWSPRPQQTVGLDGRAARGGAHCVLGAQCECGAQ